MATTLELFLQGGLGNQLIQRAYAHSLVHLSGASLRLNSLMLSPGWAALRRVAYRPRTPLLTADGTKPCPRYIQGLNLLRFYLARNRGLALHEGISDDQALGLLRAAKSPRWLPILGYFQRAQAFGPDADGFWSGFAERLLRDFRLQPRPHGQIAVHVRLGDYLLPQNQRLYAPLAIQEQLRAALSCRESYGGNHPLQVITDDPKTFLHICPEAYLEEVKLLATKDPQADFLALSSHQTIVASNSTFSLCAGKLASILWGQPRTTLLPVRWYRDPLKDSSQKHEWNQLDFLVDFWPLRK